MPRHPKIIAGIPAYNEEKSIAKVVARAWKHVDQVLVLDDGSKDDTALIAERLGAVVVRHARNVGKGVALRDLFRKAKELGASVLVTLDGDGQHDPDDIPRLVHPILSNQADISIAARIERPESMPHTRRVATRALDHLAGLRDIDTQSGYRAYSKKALETITFTEWGWGAEEEILIDARRKGLRITQVSASFKYGHGRTSKSNPLLQFSDVLSTIVKGVVVRRPFRFLAIPAAIMIAIGAYGWLDILSTYNVTAEFATGHAFIYTIIVLAGTFLMTGAIVIFVLRMTLQEAGSAA